MNLEFADLLAHFVRLLPTVYVVDDAMTELLENSVDILGVSGGSISLVSAGELRCITSIADSAGDMERCQEGLQSGPGRTAYEKGERIAVTDIRERHDLWPEFAENARRLNIAATASVPMSINGETIGVVSLYAQEPRVWSADDIVFTYLVANMATGYCVNASKRHQLQQIRSQLQESLKVRIILEQAKGITADARRTGIDEAYSLIQAHAQLCNASVSAVARAIVDVGLRV